MSVHPPDDVEFGQPDDLGYIDLDRNNRYSAAPGASRRPRQAHFTPPPPRAAVSLADPRFLVPLLLFLTAVLLIFLAVRSTSDDPNADLLAQEGQLLDQSELARRVQEAELRAGFGGLIVTEENDTIIITGTVPDNLVAASVGAVARSVEGTQRVDNRVVVVGGAVETAPTSTVAPVVAGAGGLTDQLATAGRVTFETGSTAITAEGAVTIDTVAALLNRAPGLPVEIHGHTDADGNETTNQVLSQQRAEAVVAALGQRGVDVNRLTAVGFGASNPIAPNITAEGRATNRRIEFVVQQ